jgi:hypothetical protein
VQPSQSDSLQADKAALMRIWKKLIEAIGLLWVRVASRFPENARYSRIGLLKPDYQNFMKFKKHGLNVQDT